MTETVAKTLIYLVCFACGFLIGTQFDLDIDEEEDEEDETPKEKQEEHKKNS